ncbi:MAG TPA: DUF4870 domain-containing protein [Ktedonobacterales bacterium]|jgi:uncharacterized Tic20 family protein|nr:DUF4870 domain-containing protein [Ktedonobacterales bacterium]
MNGLSFPLRSGETCALQSETLSVGQRQIPLRDIVSAGLVADVTIPAPPGMPPTPGVSLRLSDGGTLAFTPVEQLDCWRLLQALAAARPALAAPLPPPPGAQRPYGAQPGYMGQAPYGYGYGYAPQPGYFPPYGMGGPSESDRTLAGICHLSVFFAPLILPLIIWLAMRRTHPYASRQAKQAFWFHLVFSLLAIVGVVGMQVYFLTFAFTSVSSAGPSNPPTVDLSFLPFMFAFYGVLILLGLVDAIFSVIAAVQAFQGKPFHYPLLGWLDQ